MHHHLKLQNSVSENNHLAADNKSSVSANKPPMAGKLRAPDEYQRATSVNQPSSAQKSLYDTNNDNSFFTPKKSWQVRKVADTENSKRPPGGVYSN